MNADEQLTRKERGQLMDFWSVRYHNQSMAPITMSVADDNGKIRTEGGYGAWDANEFSKYVNAVSPQSKKLQELLRSSYENPESPNHPVTKIYLERQESLKKERANSVSADRERLDLQLQAEKSGWQSWAAQEKNTIFPGEFDKDVKKYEREKNNTLEALYQYDRSFNHPLTDPDRNLQSDPPTFSERRDWLLHRNAINQEKYGQRERSFDTTNDREQNALGMTPTNWLTEEEQIDRGRSAPQRSGSAIPKELIAIIEQRKELDKMLATERDGAGVAVHNNWEKVLPKPADIEKQRILDYRQQEKLLAQNMGNQATPMVSTADASRAHNSAPALQGEQKTKHRQELMEFRNNLKNNIAKVDRQPTVGQELTNAIVSQRPRNILKENRLNKEELEKQTQMEAQLRKEQEAREAAILEKVREIGDQKIASVVLQKTPERKEAEQIALHYKQKVDAGTANIMETKMSNPSYVQKRMLMEKNKPQTLQDKANQFVAEKINWVKEAYQNDRQSMMQTRDKLTGSLALLSHKMKQQVNNVRQQAAEVVRDVAHSIQPQTQQPAMAFASNVVPLQRPFPSNPLRIKSKAPSQHNKTQQPTQEKNGPFAFLQRLFPSNPLRAKRNELQKKAQSQNKGVEAAPSQNQQIHAEAMQRPFPQNPARSNKPQPVKRATQTQDRGIKRQQ